MNAPTISIVTATRNRTDLLERTLRSIADQTFTDYESIVVDDGSSADVQRFQRDLVSALGDRFRLLASPVPDLPGTGCSAARNRGARAARGAFLAFLDDDDRWIQADHLAVAAQAMEQSQADYYVAKMQGEANGEVLLKEIYHEYTLPLSSDRTVCRRPDVYQISQDDFLKLRKHQFIHPNNSIVRRTVFETLGGFVNRLAWAEDLNLALRIADVASRILYRPDVVASYRFARGDSISFTYNDTEKYLQNLYGAHHVRLTCKSRSVRNAARADEAWSYRNMARLLAAEGQSAEAFRFSWQGFSTFPTLGAAKDLLTSFRNVARPR